MALTVEAIARAKPNPKGDRWLSDKSPQRDRGRLVLRISPNGNKRFYFRYAVEGGNRVVIPMDPYTEKPRDGSMTLVQARAKADEYTAYHRANGSRDVKAHLEKLDRELKRAAAAEERRLAKEQAEADACRTYNLRSLAEEYVTSLTRRGKVRSAQDARNIFKNHLNGKPIAEKAAKDVGRSEITPLLRELVEANKGRTAAKMRSYLRAAYATAMRAEGDANAPAALIAYRVQANPVADTKALSEFTNARDRTLTASELHLYWQRLSGIEAKAIRGALQLALLLGGQRAAQLLRLKREDVDLAAGLLILRDPKGKRPQPRIHELPIAPRALAILKPLMDRAAKLECDWVFTSDGKKALFPDTLTAAVREIAHGMKDAKESPSAFMLSDIRRTAETMLAAMGVSQDLRAQLQSHGLSGVQNKHYNRHDYRLEKREALTAWSAKVVTKPRKASIIPIKGRAKP